MTSESSAASLLEPFPSTLYTPAHRAWAAHVRSFVQQHLTEEVVEECEREARVPRELIKASYHAGIWAARAPVALGGTPPPMLPQGEKADAIYELILVDELSACGAQAVVMELLGNFSMVLPLLDAFASAELRELLIRPMVQAETFCAFALTEPLQLESKPPPPQPKHQPSIPAAASAPPKKPAGPRGPRMRTTATKQADGSFILNGEKMYISYGARADYILTACTIVDPTSGGREKDAPPAAMSLLVVPAKSAGVTIKPMRLHGWRAHSTTRMYFKDVRVAGNMLLVDGRHSSAEFLSLLFNLLQSNTTGERFFTSVMAYRSARICLEDTLAFARGKKIGMKGDQRLIASSAVRYAVVQMAVEVQSMRGMVEQLAVQTAREAATSQETGHPSTSPPKRSRALAQQTALVKYACIQGLKHCAEKAITILGASSVAVGSGPGARIERIERDAKVNATAGSSENTLLEFVAKQAKL
jgi:alkylation response protein AidB-like acyl-CoA dehydrogenase